MLEEHALTKAAEDQLKAFPDLKAVWLCDLSDANGPGFLSIGDIGWAVGRVNKDEVPLAEAAKLANECLQERGVSFISIKNEERYPGLVFFYVKCKNGGHELCFAVRALPTRIVLETSVRGLMRRRNDIPKP